MNSELARSSTVSRRVRVPLVALMLASAASPRATSALELVSHSSSGKAGTTDAGSPDSTNASIGVVASLTGPPSAPLIAFQSKAKDFVASGVDVNGMSDVFLYDTAQGKVVDLLSVATNGKAGCAGTASCTDGGSYRPALAPSSIANVVVFESDAHNLTAGALPRLTNAQTQIYARNFGSDTTTLVTASAQNASKGAVGKASDAATGGGLKYAFTFQGDVTGLKGLAGATDTNSSGSDIVVWDLATNTLKLASARQGAPSTTGNGDSAHARMSADESCVVFESNSNDLDGAIPGTHKQIYVRFLATNETVLVSRQPGGTAGGNLDSTSAAPNADCSAIVFESQATNLVSAGIADSNGAPDVFVWTNPSSPKLTLVSASTSGNKSGNGASSKPRIAARMPGSTGIAITFESNANDLVIGDSVNTDVFVWRSVGGAPFSGTTTLATAKTSGQGSAGGHDPVIRGDGAAVAFASDADDLAPGVDPAGVDQIFARSLAIPGQPIALASAANDGAPASTPCAAPVFVDGTAPNPTLVFETTTSNLAVAGVDANSAKDLYSATASVLSVTASSPTAIEGEPFQIDVSRTTGLDASVTITLSVRPPASGAAATSGVDYEIATIELAAGSASKTISLPTLQDYLAEGDEGFVLHASASKGFAFVTTGDLELEIQDDDHDADGDGVLDDADDCPTTPNADQLDTDADGFGNVCDTQEGSCNDAVDDDSDGLVDCDDPECAAALGCGPSAEEDAEGDGVPNVNDNCASIANPTQADTDADGLGDACDTHEDACGNHLDDDADGGVDCDDADCASAAACAAPESDDDGDGVPNALDDCPLAPDTQQLDTDSDGFGDACDTDEGLCNDGVDNDEDALVDCADANCAKDVVCQKPDDDTDGDGVPNSIDVCPFVSDASQTDGDGDGAGDACDTKEDACANALDDDADGKTDCADANCSDAPACADPQGDVDEDGAANADDNCANVANADQSDADADGVGDACDKTPNGPPEVPTGEGGAGGGAPAPHEPPVQVDGCACSASANTEAADLRWALTLAAAAVIGARRARRRAPR